MSTDGESSAIALPAYEVAVALLPLGRRASRDLGTDRDLTEQSVAGFEDVRGTSRSVSLIEHGEDALRAASEALAVRAAAVASSMARAISAQLRSAESPPDASFETIEVAFGIALSAGLQTVFTTQAQSSVQVTLTLRCGAGSQPGGDNPLT